MQLASKRISVLSRLLAAACAVLMLGLPLSILVFWSLANDIDLLQHAQIARVAGAEALAIWHRIVGAALALAPALALAIGLWHARRCFLHFAAGRYFEAESIDRLRGFAAWVFASVVLGLLATPLLSVLLTARNPHGMHQLSFGVSSHQVMTLFVAGMVWVIAAVLTQARALTDENAQFV